MNLVSTAATSFPGVLGQGALAILAYTIVGVITFTIGFYVIDLATPGRLSHLIRTGRNPNAILITTAGIAGVGLIVAASIWGSGGVLTEGLLATLVFGTVGIAAQAIGMVAFDRIVGISVRRLVQEETTLHPAAILLAATHFLIGLIAAVAVLCPVRPA
ncbi:MAG: DUF350 domain-containing protein, partial [Thermobispora sp.]|nr:DUF350 domain-containing protein [Thermobispora sp.]